MEQTELRLLINIIEKAAKSANEYGWAKEDILDVIEAARQIPMAIIGGQVQYIWQDATCELYWFSYDSENRKDNEDWITYCNRTASECSNKFKHLITTDIEKQAINSFEFIKVKYEEGVRLSNHQIFILYFDDKESNLI